jgi:hypothetical protein
MIDLHKLRRRTVRCGIAIRGKSGSPRRFGVTAAHTGGLRLRRRLSGSGWDRTCRVLMPRERYFRCGVERKIEFRVQQFNPSRSTSSTNARGASENFTEALWANWGHRICFYKAGDLLSYSLHATIPARGFNKRRIQGTRHARNRTCFRTLFGPPPSGEFGLFPRVLNALIEVRALAHI